MQLGCVTHHDADLVAAFAEDLELADEAHVDQAGRRARRRCQVDDLVEQRLEPRAQVSRGRRRGRLAGAAMLQAISFAPDRATDHGSRRPSPVESSSSASRRGVDVDAVQAGSVLAPGSCA